ncbi:MAG: ribosomal protein S18-alanine N-acetyltransferase [Anaerolineaceae bacterium]|nr:ribosomal protein S18-alanine N-acetyltransferase [Anaerolineaceae bacterium]
MPAEPAGPQVVLRPMTLADLPQVEALDRECFPTPWPKDAFHHELTRNPHAFCWVAEVTSPAGQTEIVGDIVVWLVVDEAHVSTLAVSPSYRQQHIAQRLLAHVLRICLEKGAVLSMLEVRQSNLAAQRLYQKFGFLAVGERPGYYQDTKEDAVLMTLPVLKDEELADLADAG